MMLPNCRNKDGLNLMFIKNRHIVMSSQIRLNAHVNLVPDVSCSFCLITNMKI